MRGCKGRFGFHIVKLALVACEIDGHLQLMPLLDQPQGLGLEACINIRKFSTKLTHRIHRLLEGPEADGAPFARKLEHAADVVPHHMRCC